MSKIEPSSPKPSRAPIVIFVPMLVMSIITVAFVFVVHFQRTEPYLDSKIRYVDYRAKRKAPTLCLNYTAFGPQALAQDLVGQSWWQWQAKRDTNPNTTYDVKVVVFNHITESTVATRFPIIEAKRMDYRYVTYTDAMRYLDKTISENRMPQATRKLRKTRETLLAHFGSLSG